ncbi:hypothetical protein OOU_Y34scaffold01081g1 [Pyricularia oryzae Y34]|uniref:Uncharacterized protein n=2 Tax=Pyricularia oryzae TaxID=318829 RepID=A0AA97NLZ1_PYRO3|nr:hypothetical protein OOU_Y34scaffold01081g1 [Pyricularia oryzae Y34]
MAEICTLRVSRKKYTRSSWPSRVPWRFYQ